MQRNDPAVCWALLVLLPDPLAVVVLHREDQVGTGDKLLGQWARRFSVRSRRHSLDAREIPENVLGGRASELVGGANEQDFHARIIAQDVALRNPAFSAFGRVIDPHQFHFVFWVQRIGVRHVLWPLNSAVEAELPAQRQRIIGDFVKTVEACFQHGAGRH